MGFADCLLPSFDGLGLLRWLGLIALLRDGFMLCGRCGFLFDLVPVVLLCCWVGLFGVCSMRFLWVVRMVVSLGLLLVAWFVFAVLFGWWFV